MNHPRLLRGPGQFPFGYTPLTQIDGEHAEMLMDFGILRLEAGQEFSEDLPLERAYLLVQGEITLEFAGQSRTVSRRNCFDESPWVLHLPENLPVKITGVGPDAEVCVQRTANKTAFAPRLYEPAETADEYRGAGTMQETSTRIVRTVFDKSNAPWSNLVLGEVIGFPGKWSSYPPHHHPQPEIYYYKMTPENGFAYAENGEDVFKIRQNDATLITEGLTHPHVTPPGYALWYLWVIRHLENAPYITPIFVEEHGWVTDPDAKFWPGE